MKRTIIFLIYLAIATVMTGCSIYEGYTSSEGQMLKQYLEPSQLKELVDKPQKDVWLIDVRPESAFKKGHVPTSKNLPSDKIMDKLFELPKSQNLILMCETGGRAQMVIKKLENAGYTRLMNWGAASRYFKAYGSVSKDVN